MLLRRSTGLDVFGHTDQIAPIVVPLVELRSSGSTNLLKVSKVARCFTSVEVSSLD